MLGISCICSNGKSWCNFTLRGQASGRRLRGLGSGSQGQADPALDPWESSRPAASSRCRLCPGGITRGSRCSSLSYSHPVPTHPPARPLTGSSRPAGSLRTPALGAEQLLRSVAQPEEGPGRWRRHVPKETTGSQSQAQDPGEGRALQPANQILRERTSALQDHQSPEHTASKARPPFSSASNPQGRCAVAPPRGGDRGRDRVGAQVSGTRCSALVALV